MNFLKYIADFYYVWLEDILNIPLSYIRNSLRPSEPNTKYRLPIQNERIYVCLHEWGGYKGCRIKRVNGISRFSCGLTSQISRFKNSEMSDNISLTITMSQPELYDELDALKLECDEFVPVSNLGMDFSGYCAFFEKIKEFDNAYIILTNSSVNEIQGDYIKQYVTYMKANPDVGIIGTSSSSKYCHTLLRKNFNPHLQSFFLFTTIDVLREIVAANGNTFPGIKETNKHLLIRRGEVRLSLLALNLGYKLAVATEWGTVKFDRFNYPLPKGDLRKYARYPNRINPVYF